MANWTNEIVVAAESVLQPFVPDYGWTGPPFRWDEERRFLLRCGLDAAFFHLYGLNRDDAASQDARYARP